MDSVVLGLRVLLALACVLGLIWVLARRAGWGKGARRLAGPTVEVVGRQALGRHAGVAVLAVGNRRLLVGYGEQQITMLTELAPVPTTVPTTVPAAVEQPVGHTTSMARVVPVPPLTVAGLDADELALADPEAQPAVPHPAGPRSTDPSAAEPRPGALHGSVLAPSTWSQAVAALRERTVRR